MKKILKNIMKKTPKNLLRAWIFFWAIIVWIAVTLWFVALQDYSPDFSGKENTLSHSSGEYKTAYFAWGCFWCMEWIFEAQAGVEWAYSGYTGGEESTATYEKTSSKTTKHREAVRVVYDPAVISYNKLVELYWTQINPTDDGGQFNDRGYVYSTAIYYNNENEKEIAENSKKKLQESGRFQEDIVTLIEPAKSFYDAEEYHQDYYKKNPIRYKFYTKGSGRKEYIEQNWKDRIEYLQWKKYINAKFIEAQVTQKYTQAELKEKLTPLQYKVTQESGTERPFKNEYWDNKKAGIYVDIIDGTPLYSSLDKFDSGTGWPSFTKWINEDNFVTHTDTRFFMTRTEVRSASSNAHLWHIFPDAPKELWWIRHCINSASLRFIALEKLENEWYGEYIEMFQ